MYDASKYTDPQQQYALLINDTRTTDFRHFGRRSLADNTSSENCSRLTSTSTNGWHRDSDRPTSRSAAEPTSSCVLSVSNGGGVQPLESAKLIVAPPSDEASFNALSGANVTDYHHLMTSVASGYVNNGVSGVAMSSLKTPSKGLRLNINNFSSSRGTQSEVGGSATAGNSISTSGYSGVDVVDAPYRTDSVTTTTTASTASSSSPGCETPGDEPAFSPAAATRPRRSTEGRYRLVSLVDQYFPVTFSGSECSEPQNDRMLCGRASSVSGLTVNLISRRNNGRSHSSHHHQHKRRNHHRHNDEHRYRQQQQQHSHRRPGSGHSSSSSRSAASSVDMIYGPVVAATLSPSGDVIPLNGL